VSSGVVLSGVVWLLDAKGWAFAGQVPLELVQEAGLAEPPVAMDAEDLGRLAGGDRVANLLDQPGAVELVVERRFVVEQ
jgi:hypothetical protein